MKAESFSKCVCYKIIAFKAMAGSWTAEETRALITIWSQESVQDELKRVHRNRDIFQRISMELEDWIRQDLATVSNKIKKSNHDIQEGTRYAKLTCYIYLIQNSQAVKKVCSP